MKLKKDNVYGFLVIHLIAGLAVFPWFFSWTGVVLLVAGLFVFGVLGINLCFHRLLTHRSFSCPLWLEHALATLAVCSVQDSPPHWVAVHRRHHRIRRRGTRSAQSARRFFLGPHGLADGEADDMSRRPLIERYAKDIIRDPYYAWLERRSNWIKVVAAVMARVFRGRALPSSRCPAGALAEPRQFGLSLLIWGAVLRTVVVWHITWSVNSVTHVWGYRNYNTPDVSRNNALVALLSLRRRLAQQPPRRFPLGAARPQVVGDRPDLARDPPADAARPCQECRPALADPGGEIQRPTARGSPPGQPAVSDSDVSLAPTCAAPSEARRRPRKMTIPQPAQAD